MSGAEGGSNTPPLAPKVPKKAPPPRDDLDTMGLVSDGGFREKPKAEVKDVEALEAQKAIAKANADKARVAALALAVAQGTMNKEAAAMTDRKWGAENLKVPSPFYFQSSGTLTQVLYTDGVPKDLLKLATKIDPKIATTVQNEFLVKTALAIVLRNKGLDPYEKVGPGQKIVLYGELSDDGKDEITLKLEGKAAAIALAKAPQARKFGRRGKSKGRGGKGSTRFARR